MSTGNTDWGISSETLTDYFNLGLVKMVNQTVSVGPHHVVVQCDN